MKIIRAQCGPVTCYGPTPAKAEQMLRAALDTAGLRPNHIQFTEVQDFNPEVIHVCPSNSPRR